MFPVILPRLCPVERRTVEFSASLSARDSFALARVIKGLSVVSKLPIFLVRQFHFCLLSQPLFMAVIERRRVHEFNRSQKGPEPADMKNGAPLNANQCG